ncbi:MAG: FtsQ-type POTRA domain-containing protein [Gammaproteobacteria bacterium]|nr:FtsQ-type POTRA domain-containing protein [Gammaproteobacteria bacterium]
MTDLRTNMSKMGIGGSAQRMDNESADTGVARRTWPIFAGFIVLIALALGVDRVVRSGYFTIQRVEVMTSLDVVDRGMVERAAWRSLTGNYLNVDLRRIETKLERLPGVYQSVVRRVWPDTLAIEINETHARAEYREWGVAGAVSSARFINLPPEYMLEVPPVLEGPAPYQNVLAETFRSILVPLTAAGLLPQRLSVSPAGRWEMELIAKPASSRPAFRVLLGREDIQQKVARFADSYQSALASRAGFISRVDMRYANGFAVRWIDDANQEGYQLASLTTRQD